MSYTDLRDFEVEYETVTDAGFMVKVQKLGGGTVGREYAGTWRYIVTDAAGQELGRGQDLETGRPKTHAEVAEIVADFFEGA